MIFLSRFVRSLLTIVALIASLGLTGCASPGRTRTDDPWQGFNRAVYKFNDTVDRAAIRPVAKGYQTLTPGWMRTGVSNFFNNLELPWTVVNDLLQGKPIVMAQDTCRFVLNSTVGLGGLIDVAGKLAMPANEEDFGQTLAVWGISSGPYIMLPLLGPSTLRDGAGRGADYFGRPVRYADIPWETEIGLGALEVISARERLLSVDGTLNGAYDKYGVVRDAWIQQREYRIFDGNPPEEQMDPELQQAEEESAE